MAAASRLRLWQRPAPDYGILSERSGDPERAARAVLGTARALPTGSLRAGTTRHGRYYPLYTCRPRYSVGTKILGPAKTGWPNSGPMLIVLSTVPVAESMSVRG